MREQTDLVEQAVREACSGIPGVSLLYAVGPEDKWHDMHVRQTSGWRILLRGWTTSYHNAIIHTVVFPRLAGTHDELRASVATQVAKMLDGQRRRAANGLKLHGIGEPFAREPFEDDGGDIEVDHLVVSSIPLMRMAAEEGTPGRVRRRIARLANREIRRRERVNDRIYDDVSLKNTTLWSAVPLGERAVLDTHMLFIRDQLPETAIVALGETRGGPLSRIVDAPGIDHLTIADVTAGQVFSNDHRRYARECSFAIRLEGNSLGRVDRLLESLF